MCRKSRGSLVHRASCPCLFPCAGRRNLLPAVPLSKLPRIIPSCSSSSSEFLRSLLPPLPFRARALLPGSLPSSRHHRVRPLISRVPKSSIRSVRRCSQPHDGFLRTRLSGLFHPAAASRALTLVQGLPISAQRSCLVGTICPLAVASASRSPGRILTATAGALGFEAFIRAGARAPRGR